MDRGYAKFGLFRRILDLGSSFVCRIRDNSVYEVLENRELSAEARAAGICHDRVVRFTGKQSLEADLDRPVRLIEVQCNPHRKPTGHTGRGGPEQGETLLIALWTGKKPTLRTYEMICFYFSGLADEEELLAHIQKLRPQAA